MNCVKLWGQKVMACNFERQVAELHIRAAVLNGDTALGISVQSPQNDSVRGKGTCGLHPLCATKPVLIHNAPQT